MKNKNNKCVPVKEVAEAPVSTAVESALKVEYNDENEQVTSARRLWEWLGVDTPFTMWFNRRVEEFGFVENEDYCLINLSSENEVSNKNVKNLGGRPQQDYAIKIDMAKELSMVERTEKGKQARKYFLQCEKVAKDPSLVLNGMTSNQIQLYCNMVRKNERLQLENQRQKERLTRWLLPTELFNMVREDFPALKRSAQMHTGTWSVNKVIKTLGWLDEFGNAKPEYKEYIVDFSTVEGRNSHKVSQLGVEQIISFLNEKEL